MNFLVPAAWSWLGLAVPVVVFYLIRTRLERRSVSTLLFWKQLQTQSYNSALWRKLRRWLSLLLQLLFLVLVVFALAQPLASWQSLQPARLVFILDPSASMLARDDGPGSESRWEKAVKILGQRIRQMRPFDRAAILVGGEPPQVLTGWTSSRRTLLESLKKARHATGEVSLDPALAVAKNLQAMQANSSILLLTDGVWNDAVPTGIDCVWLGGEQPNVGITYFSARRSFSSPGEVRLEVEIVSSAREKRAGTFELSRGKNLVDAQSLSLAPGETWQHEWDLTAQEAATFEARLTGFPPDVLAEDDAVSVSVASVTPLKVFLVSEPSPWLEAAMAALPLVDWKKIEPAGLPNVPEAGAFYIFNRQTPPAGFSSADCLLIDPPANGFWGESQGAMDHPLVSDVQKDQPLLQNTGFSQVSLDKATKWKKPPGAEVFADCFGEPLVYGQWSERRHWALLAFHLDGSDFVLRTAFPILLGNAVESLRPVTGVSPGAAPGRIESALVPAARNQDNNSTHEASTHWGLAFPFWWWAVCVGCLWLLGEWWLYTRKITE